MIERLKRYVSIRSLSREEGALADAVRTDLCDAGLRVSHCGNNLWCEVGDAVRPRILLNSHIDTVAAGQGWAHDPWTPQVNQGRISGLGANDAKGCGVAMIEAVLALKRSLDDGAKLDGTVVLALTAEEENTGQGLGTILDKLGPLDAALVGEPTGLRPMTAQRGLLILRCEARGRTAHPANTPTDSADNAIHAAAGDIVRITEFNWGPAHALLGAAHAHVTQIAGGVARNVVPDRCEFFVDVRTTPLESHADLTGRVRAHLDCDVCVHSERLVPVETSNDEPIVQAVLRALPGSTPAGSPAMSDMVFLPNVPSVKIGPGESERSHTPNEYVTIDELNAGAAAYERIVLEFFGNRPRLA